MTTQPSDTTGDDNVLTADIYARLLRLAAVVDPLNPDPADLVQEAIARTLRRGHLTELRGPEAYLARVIIRLASNRRRHILRTRKAVERVSNELQVNAQSTDEAHREALVSLVSLRANERAILYLRIVEGHSFADIAETLGIKEATARQRSSRALAHLRSHYRIE